MVVVVVVVVVVVGVGVRAVVRLWGFGKSKYATVLKNRK